MYKCPAHPDPASYLPPQPIPFELEEPSGLKTSSQRPREGRESRDKYLDPANWPAVADQRHLDKVCPTGEFKEFKMYFWHCQIWIFHKNIWIFFFLNIEDVSSDGIPTWRQLTQTEEQPCLETGYYCPNS